MKLMWFHLMPYTELPDDFREKHPSVWVDIHSSLFDPKRAHHMYNDFMDELEYAADCGFDAICVNEHHSNGYGLMPSPNLIAVVAGAPHHRHGDLRHGQLARALQSADPRRRRIRHDRLHLRRPADRRLPGRHADGHLLTPTARTRSQLRERYHEAHDLVHARPGPSSDTFAFNGRFNQQRYVNIWPRPVQQPASADLDPRRRLGRDLAVVRRDGLRLLLPVLLRLQGRPARRWTASGTRWRGSARTAIRTAPASLQFVGVGREPPAGDRSLHARPPSISTAAACTSIRASPRRPATPPRRRSAPASKAR